ncbi:menaquinol:cytochrome c oxidoreductase (iron-sulfur subunit) [[Clostridium] ultunense Esp]|uniref:QcrA and Rieske domain-containing protein n=1 Tax=Thermicanus aegyptius TaxID=94009 RepID=UPI0002B70EAA|nr:ubiquinol-cytochrome c reductase iron-sulfur subunit [Thermicanus aegyptius]CCQ93623.1 menaquinol:cytochrome c oxidoreductase (iron-sulfur subunit) [[Clostridium] ultunense Esp]
MSERDLEQEREPDRRAGEVSRRQFLTYTLMGVGGFLAATILTPMIRAAIDPALKAGTESSMVPVADINEITTEPKSFSFKVKMDDAWVKGQDTTLMAWVYKDGDKIMAMSPICKHLGCTVNWNTNPKFPEHFFCPCHGGLYTKDGINVPGTPPKAPLDLYDYQVKDGKLYLGKLIQRT